MLAKPLVSDRLTAWHVLAAAILGALGVLVTWDAWVEIFQYAWHDEEASHIFFVLPFAFWMIWVRRMRFRHCRPSGTIIGPLILVGGWWLSNYGFNHSKTVFYHLGSMLVVLGCLFSMLGKNVLFRFFPAVAVLVFIVPIPGTLRQSIALPLEHWTARIAQALLEIMGVQTEVSGNLLSINGTGVTIAEACNGMRLVFPLFLIAYLFCFGLPLRNSVRFLVLLASPLTALVCNVIRTLPIIWLYGYGSKSFAHAFHDYSGWLMLPIAFLLLLGIIRLMRWALLPVTRYTLAAQ
jgi:exosortase